MNIPDKPELRRIQTIHGEKSFILVLPRNFVRELKISKGDYLKCLILDNRLVVEKAEL